MKIRSVLIATSALLAVGTALHASTNAAGSDTAWTMMTGLLDGWFGKSLAAVLFAVGLFMGIARENLIATACASFCAFAAFLGPQILTDIVSGLTTTSSVPCQSSTEVNAATCCPADCERAVERN